MVDYKQVRAALAKLMNDPSYEDGSYGPLFVRLAWHASGTFDIFHCKGGSNGGRIRFEPECKWAANAGLHIAMQRLESLKKLHPGISYADLYTLAGVVAVEGMGGPKVQWRPGRVDCDSGKDSPEDGRLPDASKGVDHLRAIFYRMGFSDRDIVALSGAHCFGRCHRDRSGYEGAWTTAPTKFSNVFFVNLLNREWKRREWDGPLQYQSGTLMMLPSDLALLENETMKKYVEVYAEDQEVFAADFAAAFSRLLELGCTFTRL